MIARSFARMLMVAAFAVVGAAAQAAPIMGGVNFMGNATPVPAIPNSWFGASGMQNPLGWTVFGSSGNLAAAMGTVASFSAFNWSPPSIGTVIFSYTAANGVTFSLTLQSVIGSTGTANPDSISVNGTGLLTSSDPVNFGPTFALWNFIGTIAAQGRDVGFSVVAVPSGRVPEPGTLALIGIGLAGLGLARRRATAR